MKPKKLAFDMPATEGMPNNRLREHLEWCPGDNDPGHGGPWLERLRFLVLAMAGEVGEAANIMKKQWRDGIFPVGVEDRLKKEIADTVAYALLIGEHMGFSVASMALDNMKAAENSQQWQQAATARATARRSAAARGGGEITDNWTKKQRKQEKKRARELAKEERKAAAKLAKRSKTWKADNGKPLAH
jgi:hypothetical protein